MKLNSLYAKATLLARSSTSYASTFVSTAKFQKNLTVILASMLLLLVVFIARSVIMGHNKPTHSTQKLLDLDGIKILAGTKSEPIHFDSKNSRGNSFSSKKSQSLAKNNTASNRSNSSSDIRLSPHLKTAIEDYLDIKVSQLSSEEIVSALEDLHSLEEIALDDLLEVANASNNSLIIAKINALSLDTIDADSPEFNRHLDNIKNFLYDTNPKTRQTALRYYIDYSGDVSSSEVQNIYSQETNDDIKSELLSQYAALNDTADDLDSSYAFLEREAQNPNNSQSVREAAELSLDMLDDIYSDEIYEDYDDF